MWISASSGLVSNAVPPLTRVAATMGKFFHGGNGHGE